MNRRSWIALLVCAGAVCPTRALTVGEVIRIKNEFNALAVLLQGESYAQQYASMDDMQRALEIKREITDELTSEQVSAGDADRHIFDALLPLRVQVRAIVRMKKIANNLTEADAARATGSILSELKEFKLRLPGATAQFEKGAAPFAKILKLLNTKQESILKTIKAHKAVFAEASEPAKIEERPHVPSATTSTTGV